MDGLIWAPGRTRSSRDLKQFGWFEMGPGGNEERSHEISRDLKQFGWFEMGPGGERISRDLKQFGWFEMVPERPPGEITRDLVRSLSRKISHTDKSNSAPPPLAAWPGRGPASKAAKPPPLPPRPPGQTARSGPPHPSPHPPPHPSAPGCSGPPSREHQISTSVTLIRSFGPVHAHTNVRRTSPSLPVRP